MSNLFFWIFILLISIWATHWGSDNLATPFEKLRQQWGLNQATGAALVALATASPEIGTNAASAIQGVSDIGLGNLLGSSIISIPVVVTVAYIAAQRENFSDNSEDLEKLTLKPQALTVQGLPYVIMIVLVALLTIPQPWRGLQPIDGGIMVVAYFLYLTYAVTYQSQTTAQVSWKSPEIILAILGTLMLIFGAYFIVIATENIVSLLGISQLVGGLFITSTFSVLPEVFATWSLAKNGQITTATTSVIADNIATLTLALFPLAMLTIPIEDINFYLINLVFIAALGLFYIVFLGWKSPKYSFSRQEILIFDLIYVIYLGIMVYVIYQFKT